VLWFVHQKQHPPKVVTHLKLSKKQVRRRAIRRLPRVRFRGRQLTSFAGLILFHAVIARLNLRERLRACFRHLKVENLYNHATVVLGLVIHLLLGYRELRDVKFYEEDPVVRRTWSLKRLPNVSTISRVLASIDMRAVEELRALVRDLVLTRLGSLCWPRITLDFDGCVIRTNRWAEGTAVGFNPRQKGQRSYYPLFCTVAQTGQVLDVLHRPGNVHDSQGAAEFIRVCVLRIRSVLPTAIIEVRMDSAFFSNSIVQQLQDLGVELSISVPFARFVELKQLVQGRNRWRRLNASVSYFELDWKPKSWPRRYRFLAVRTRTPVRQRGAVQLDLFEPFAYGFEFKVIVTNKKMGARAVVAFHNGRGAQEAVFAELKSQGHLEYVPTRKLPANQVYLFASVLAYNLNRELQMQVREPERTTTAKRPALWKFEKLGTIRRKFVQRAGTLTKPQGKLTLTLNENRALKTEMCQYLDALEAAGGS
jgi:hypothetical protein